MSKSVLASTHILSYGILCGTTIWHSFINGPLAYKTLPRQQFGTLQGRLFPPFFALQVITGAICFFTSYVYAVPVVTNRALYVMGSIGISGILNLAVVGPWTTVRKKIAPINAVLLGYAD